MAIHHINPASRELPVSPSVPQCSLSPVRTHSAACPLCHDCVYLRNTQTQPAAGSINEARRTSADTQYRLIDPLMVYMDVLYCRYLIWHFAGVTVIKTVYNVTFSHCTCSLCSIVFSSLTLNNHVSGADNNTEVWYNIFPGRKRMQQSAHLHKTRKNYIYICFFLIHKNKHFCQTFNYCSMNQCALAEIKELWA